MVETGKVVPIPLTFSCCVKTTIHRCCWNHWYATEGLSDVALVTGSTAMVMDNGTAVATGPVGQLSAPDLNNEQWMYDPVAAIIQQVIMLNAGIEVHQPLNLEIEPPSCLPIQRIRRKTRFSRCLNLLKLFNSINLNLLK